MLIYPFISFPWFSDLQRPSLGGWSPKSYTMRLNELVQQQFPQLNALDDTQLLAALKAVIFDKINISAIRPEYRDAFVLGFGLEFWLDEIGQETVDSFLLAVRNVIQKSSNKINYLYELSEKQLFKTYTHRVTDVNQDTTGNKKSTRDFTDSSTTSTTSKADGSTSGTAEQTGKTDDSRTTDNSGSITGTNSGITDSNTTENGKNVNLFQDTPQDGLEGVEDLEYLTDARIVNSSGTTTNHSNTSGTNQEDNESKSVVAGNTSNETTTTTSGTSNTSTEATGSGSLTHDEDTNEDTIGNTKTAGTEDTYVVDYDMVRMAGTTLDAVWDLFSDCFMEVY